MPKVLKKIPVNDNSRYIIIRCPSGKEFTTPKRFKLHRKVCKFCAKFENKANIKLCHDNTLLKRNKNKKQLSTEEISSHDIIRKNGEIFTKIE